ncbi:hypothetical protein [Kordia jejudonensis]|uniref:hypothetical protein n=1 Tax=Kordia jejudonensis TaxID=1348245 RepID=UPI0006293409|nr:hypothetical protein [Kordia jejudonensis]
MGTFLASITNIQFFLFVLVYTAVLILLAYKKPKWYKVAFFVFVGIVMAGIIYTMAWNAAMEHTFSKIQDRTLIDNYFYGAPNFTFLIHFLWLNNVWMKRVKKLKEEIEN